MPKYNLHISFSNLLYRTRLLKETESLVKHNIVSNILICALWEKGLAEHEQLDSRRVIWRIPLKTRSLPKCLAIQLIKYLEFTARCLWYYRKQRISIVNCHALSILPIGWLFKRIFGSKVVYDAYELETDTHSLSGLRKVIAKHIERILIKYVDLVIVVSDSINEWYRHKYQLSDIVTVLNCPEFQEPQRTRHLHLELDIPAEKKIVLYQGGLMRGRGLHQLLITFEEYNDDKHVLVLMGYGELESLIKQYADLCSNIYFHEAVPPSALLKYTASADVGICCYENGSLNHQFCLPNKLFEYIAAGLPVIVSSLPEMRRVVNENQIGIVLDGLTSQSLGRALDELIHMTSVTLSKNLRRTANLFSWQNQEKRMLNAYRQLPL